MSNRLRRQYASQKGEVYEIPGVGIGIAAKRAAPTASQAGFAPGALYLDLTNKILYYNSGTATSATWLALIGYASQPTPTLTELNLLSGLLATAAELNRVAKPSTRVVAAGGANLTVTQALHDGKTILLDQATGTAVTLPAMSGSGSRYRFFCSVSTSGGSQVITATGAHLFGTIMQNTDSANGSSGFTVGADTSASGSTVITLNGSTQGGRKGDWFEIEDVAASIGAVRGALNASGAEATPFS